MARLGKEPPIRVDTLAELVGIAHEIETEAIRCYSRLAAAMRRRSEPATAEAFEAMAREEDAHVAAVEGWARGLGEPIPTEGRFRWRLSADLADSWEQVEGSALLTPYRAYAIAVENEERAFAFYAYVAASADDRKIAHEAEALAREELKHAALLRTWRRAAWRREREAAGKVPAPAPAETAEELAHLIATSEAEVAACHRLLGERLRRLDDDVSAALLDSLAAEATARAAAPVPGSCGTDECTADEPLALLLAAQRPLERLCTTLETALQTASDERMQTVAQEALSGAVSRIARLGRRIEALDPTAGSGSEM